MAGSVVKDSGSLLRRVTIIWSVVFALIIAAFFITIAALNNGLYSAHGFVGSYLQSLARHDVAEALATDGVELTEGVAGNLLTPDALGKLDDIRLVSDTVDGKNHRVVYSYSFGSATAKTEFTVTATGTRFGLFPTWRFVESPISTLTITALHDPRFDVNGQSVTLGAGESKPTTYQVLTPGLYQLTHTSTFLTAKKVPVSVTTVGSTTKATIDVQANDHFVSQVEDELHKYLDACATQEVLLPTGCPFGYETGNRIEGKPVWSMSTYPAVTIIPGPKPNTWQVPATPAAAHLKVNIRSLFDGRVSVFDKDLPFTVRYLITVDPVGGMQITAQYD